LADFVAKVFLHWRSKILLAVDRARRIGVLVPYAADDREGQARMAAFQKGLAELGWSHGGTKVISDRATIRSISI
jgi:hypothetical protein